MRLYSIITAICMVAILSAPTAKAGNEYIASVDNDSVQRVRVTAGAYYFSPDHIIVKKNVAVELVIKKEPGFTPHNITLKAPEAGMDIDVDLSSDPKTIKFVPTLPGKYPFYCNKKLPFAKSHREKGMEGVLEVLE